MSRTANSLLVLAAATALTIGLVAQVHSSPSQPQAAQPLGGCPTDPGGDAPLVVKCVPPGGGSVTNCSGAPTTFDNTCAVITFPPGPGGNVRIDEEQPLPSCSGPAIDCLGLAVQVVLPPGYNDPDRPVIVKVYYDRSTAPNGQARGLHQKFGVDKVSPPCVASGTPVFPCLESSQRISGRDIRLAWQLTSSDPKFQGFLR